ncbi:unnamed protein product, partial [Didymodactylos carnosus]
MGFCGGLLQTR